MFKFLSKLFGFGLKQEPVPNENVELEILKNKVKSLENVIKQLIEMTTELAEEQYPETQITTELKQPNKFKEEDNKIQLLEHRQNELNKKYDAILDILAEKFSNDEPLPNLFVGDISLRDLWRKYPNHKDSLLYSIAYMMKMQIEEKGRKIR